MSQESASTLYYRSCRRVSETSLESLEKRELNFQWGDEGRLGRGSHGRVGHVRENREGAAPGRRE